MRFIFAILLFVAVSFLKLPAQNCSTISDVQVKNSWIIIFDNNGKKVSQMPESKNEVVGIAGNFFVVTNNNWIITYDEKCKRISQMPQSNKIVKGAAGETFTAESNGWIITYDKNCKEKNRRPK